MFPHDAMIVMRLAFLIFQVCQSWPANRKFIPEKTTDSSFAHSITSFSSLELTAPVRTGEFWLTELLLVTSFVPAVTMASDL